MGKFIKPGKVVVLLAGRYAGKKAIVVKTYDDGTPNREFSHCLVAGIERAPRRVCTTNRIQPHTGMITDRSAQCNAAHLSIILHQAVGHCAINILSITCIGALSAYMMCSYSVAD